MALKDGIDVNYSTSKTKTKIFNIFTVLPPHILNSTVFKNIAFIGKIYPSHQKI